MKEYQLNRTRNILGLDGTDPPQMPVLSENFMLDKLMAEIRLSGHLEDILSIIQKVEKRFPKYRDSFWYQLPFPGPFLLVRSIENEFNLNEKTKKLFKYLDWDKREIVTSNVIYITNLIFGVLSAIAIIVVALKGFYWLLWVIPLFGISIFTQLQFFAHTIKHIGFVQIYKQICDVLESHYQEHCAYVQKVIGFPEQVQQRWQEMERNNLFESMSAAEKKHRQELELKIVESLQDLAATVAINQATTEAEVQKIKDATKLNYRAAELKIFDRIDEKKRQHELALSALESMGRCLVEQAKAVAKDSQERQKIEYQLHLLNGIRSKTQSEGSAAMGDESTYDAINKMMEMMMNPDSTNGNSNS